MTRDDLEAGTEDRQAKNFYTTPYKKKLLRDPEQNVCVR